MLPPSGTVTFVTATFEPVAAAVLVRVTVPVPVVTPVASVIVSGLGVIDSAARVATPVPDSATGEPVTATLPVIVTVPLARAVPVGVNVTLIVQLPPAANVPPQLPPDRVNGAVTATVMPVRLAVPVLCSVSVRAELVVPVAQLPNASGPPVTLAIPTGVTPVPVRGTGEPLTATLAVSDDHLILAQQVTQETNDNEGLLPMVEAVRRQCRSKPERITADSGFFSLANLKALEAEGIDAYVPDSNMARWLKWGGHMRTRATVAAHRRMRRKLRDPAGRRMYQRRKAVVEPVIGVLKQQRGMRQFARRGLQQVAVELALAATAYNLTRLWRTK